MAPQNPQEPEVMRMRMRPVASGTINRVLPPGPSSFAAPPPWRFVIPAADGTELLVMREEEGRLVVEGDESRWDEGARAFLHHVMQWCGQAGITWKDEARKAPQP
jgi:hypothetical protein